MTAPVAPALSLVTHYLAATEALTPKQQHIAARSFDASARLLNAAGITSPDAWHNAVDDAVAAAAECVHEWTFANTPGVKVCRRCGVCCGAKALPS